MVLLKLKMCLLALAISTDWELTLVEPGENNMFRLVPRHTGCGDYAI